MVDIRLVVLDIDGTISGQSNQVRPAVIEAVKRIQQEGIQVAIATGRMFQSAQRFHRVLASDLPIIAYNGAWVQDPFSQILHQHFPVPTEIGLQILDYLAQEPWRSHLHIHVYHQDQLYVQEFNGVTEAYQERTGCMAELIGDLRDIVHQSATKILTLCHTEEIPSRLLQAVKQQYAPEQIHCTQSNETFVEFTCPGATKGAAVKFLTEELLGLQPENVMAIGDNFNDQEMLIYAGIGVAMGGAPNRVKNIADYVTADVDHDGVAEAIAQFIF